MKFIGGCIRQSNANVLSTEKRRIYYSRKVHRHERKCTLREILKHFSGSSSSCTYNNTTLYLRSKLLHELKHVLDVFCGLLPHVVGLLTTHVCSRSHWDGVERGEWAGKERHVNTEPLPLLSDNPILMSRLPHHHNHKAPLWIIGKSWGSRLWCVRCTAQTVWGRCPTVFVWRTKDNLILAESSTEEEWSWLDCCAHLDWETRWRCEGEWGAEAQQPMTLAGLFA